MTEHLPECLALLNDCTWDGDCICKALRACEERMLTTYLARDNFEAGLHAAREAVAIAPMGSGAYNTKAADIAAIDALRKE